MSYVPLLAPLAAFLVVLLTGAGFYRTANRGGLLARKRLSAFAPPSSVTLETPVLQGMPLFKQQRFSSIAGMDRLLQRRDFGARTSMELARAALPLKVGEYMLMRCLLALAGLLLVDRAVGFLPLAAIVGAVGYALPALYVHWRQARRVRQFDDQLVDALTLLANALKSGYSFMQGMETIAHEMPDPIGTEFDQAIREVRVGGAVDE
ncbi:MAG TPA: hypothetical protein VKU60_16075, partial [Chloroflexota bacterium]|nr:hypothetical protein [Chloroflexota bacterium]